MQIAIDETWYRDIEEVCDDGERGGTAALDIKQDAVTRMPRSVKLQDDSRWCIACNAGNDCYTPYFEAGRD